MKANELARKAGTLPWVMKLKSRVPAPAVKSAMDGSIPTSTGTRTRAPKATKIICPPMRSVRMGCSGYVMDKEMSSPDK